MTSNYTFRKASIADTETIADHRYLMFAEMGMDTAQLTKARIHYTPWLAERLSNGVYTGLLAECEGEIVAGAGMWVSLGAPLPTLASADFRRAHVVNVYVYPEHRRKGLARQLMNRLLDLAREDGYPVVLLHASDAGRSLYESLGFQNTNELRIVL